METNRLRQFCTICETGNLRAAAEILNLSHSALSKSMKVLQEEIGMALLAPSGRGIQLTDQGKEFYGKAHLFLQQEQDLLSLNLVKSATFRIGTFEVFSTYLIPGHWNKYLPQHELELRELLPGHMEAALVNDEIDLAITYEPIPTAGLDFLKIGKIPMGIFAKANVFVNLELKKIPFVAPVTPINAIPSGSKGLDGWPDDKVSRNVKYRADMLESGLALARNGDAAIFMPVFLAMLHNENTNPSRRLVEISHAGQFRTVYRDVYLVKRKSSAEGELIKKVSRLIRTECLNRN